MTTTSIPNPKRNRPHHECSTQSPCCLSQLTLNELHEVISLAIVGARQAVATNDQGGIDYFREWHDKFSDELARRRRDGER
jgi:hypothetical protein